MVAASTVLVTGPARIKRLTAATSAATGQNVAFSMRFTP